MSNKPKTQPCPRCHGTGLEETAIGCRRCRKCYGKGRVAVEDPVCAGARKANGHRPHYEVREISPDARNRFVSGPEDFTVIKTMDLSSRKLIAVSGDRFLEETSPGQGRVLIPSRNFEGPVHSIISIVARGYWEPLVKDVADQVLKSTTFNHSQKRKEVRKHERKGKTHHGDDG